MNPVFSLRIETAIFQGDCDPVVRRKLISSGSGEVRLHPDIRYLYSMKIILIAALIISSIWQSFAQAPPDFTLVDQDSVSWNLYDELGKGNTVLLDFFFASCVPCQTFTPEIEQLYKDYGSGTGGLIVLGISDRDNNAVLAAFDSTYGVTYPTGGTQGDGGTITNLYMAWFGSSWWPQYAVVCTDTSIFWGISPSIGMPEIRNKIDTCAIVTEVSEVNSSSIQFSIYPNPAMGHVNINLSNSIPDEALISLYDLHGVRIRQMNVVKGDQMLLNLDDVQTGYYLIEVSHRGIILGREKLVLFH